MHITARTITKFRNYLCTIARRVLLSCAHRLGAGRDDRQNVDELQTTIAPGEGQIDGGDGGRPFWQYGTPALALPNVKVRTWNS